ncbi:MAG: phage portal protein [Planctomycetota bacterium]
MKQDNQETVRALELLSEGIDPREGVVAAPQDDEARDLLGGDGDIIIRPFGYVGGLGTAATGVRVTPELALTASAVYACINVLATAIGQLPVHVVDRDNGGQVRDHPAQAVLDEPNAYMTRAEFFEAFMVNLLGWGNGYAVAPRDRASYRVTELLPVLSSCTEPRRRNGQLYYITQPAGWAEASTIRPDNMLCVKNMSFNGMVGISPIEAARNTLGVSLALEEFAGTFFKNGAAVQAVIELPDRMSSENVTDFKRSWESNYVGVGNAHRMAAVTGIKVHKVGSSAEEAQVVDSRVHQVREACRVFRVPPHKVADLERSTYSNMEEQERDFATNSIGPWAIKIEQALDQLLLRADERRRLRVRFNLDATLRASTKDRYEAHAKACGSPFMTVNEVRALENLPPVKGGDKLISPLNMTPAEGRQLARAVRHGAGQAVRKQINAVKRAAKKHAGDRDGFDAWAGQFFEDQAELVSRALGEGDQAEAIARDDCRRAGLEARGAFAARQVDELLDRWEARAEGLTRAVIDAQPPPSEA